MHKFFAKTLFIGKNVVFLPHCHSTNELAKELAKSDRIAEGTLVMTDYQEKGKGQQGNVWLSEPGKNLLFTIFLTPRWLTPQRQFLLNIISSLALCETIAELIPQSKTEIKWPNDIYVDDHKIAGILTEAVIMGPQLEQVFCGVGLNVNQSHFQLTTATSLHLIAGKIQDRDAILEDFLVRFESYYHSLQENPEQLIAKYEKMLRWRGELRTYKVEEVEVVGVLQGIDDQGKLRVSFNGKLRHFGFKEIIFQN